MSHSTSERTAEQHIWQALDSFTDGFAELADDDDFPWRIAGRVATALNLDDFVLYLREGPTLVQVAAFGVKAVSPSTIHDPITIPIGHGIVGRAGQEKSTIYVPDVSQMHGYIADHFAGKSELSVPLIVNSELVGIFDSESRRLGGFEIWRIRALEIIAAAAAPRILLWKNRRDERERRERARGRRAEAIGTFAGSIAHDLNNLLAAVELNAELLRATSRNSPRVERSLSKIVDRARILTSRLLTLTTSGPVTMEILDFASLVREEAGEAAPAGNIVVRLDIEDDLPLVRGDPAQVPLMIHNVVVNALEAIGSDPGTVTLRAYSERDEQLWVCLDVIDDGPGIDPTVIDQLFDPYFTTKPHGAGLGLASAYWAALQHGGDLRLESGAKSGATFSLRIPGQEGRIVSSPPAQPTNRSLGVLLLEDDELVASSLLEILEMAGHRCTVVRRGEEVAPAWRQALENGERYDVAILDIRNSIGEGGVFALEELHSIDDSIRAIAMSGYSDQTLDEVVRSGFVATLPKPFRIDELTSAIASALGDPAAAS